MKLKVIGGRMQMDGNNQPPKSCITSFTKEWSELRIHREREVASGVRVVLSKVASSYVTVYLDGLRDVPPLMQYAHRARMLLHAILPADYDCTEEDKARKIAEAITRAETAYDGIHGQDVTDLQRAIDGYHLATHKIQSVLSKMKEAKK